MINKLATYAVIYFRLLFCIFVIFSMKSYKTIEIWVSEINLETRPLISEIFIHLILLQCFFFVLSYLILLISKSVIDCPNATWRTFYNARSSEFFFHYWLLWVVTLTAMRPVNWRTYHLTLYLPNITTITTLQLPHTCPFAMHAPSSHICIPLMNTPHHARTCHARPLWRDKHLWKHYLVSGGKKLVMIKEKMTLNRNNSNPVHQICIGVKQGI